MARMIGQVLVVIDRFFGIGSGRRRIVHCSLEPTQVGQCSGGVPAKSDQFSRNGNRNFFWRDRADIESDG